MATSANRFEHRTNAIDRLGRTVVYAGELLRHPVYTRFLHWMVGIFFFLALLPASLSNRFGEPYATGPSRDYLRDGLP